MKRANALNGISVACSITHNNEVIVCNTITQYNNMVKSVTLSKSHLRKMAEKHHRLLKLTYTNLWTKQPVQQPVQKLKLSIFKKEKGRKLEGIGISKQNQLIKKKKKIRNPSVDKKGIPTVIEQLLQALFESPVYIKNVHLAQGSRHAKWAHYEGSPNNLYLCMLLPMSISCRKSETNSCFPTPQMLCTCKE